MKMFVEPSEVFLHRDFVDFRKSINGLVSIVEDELVRDAYTGTLFVFCNKAKDKLKILYWDKTGFALWYKRLEKQKFKWPSVNSLVKAPSNSRVRGKPSMKRKKSLMRPIKRY
ncbi:IS66 family insertion sequence element accessory protein TnpB [Pseudoalteromonas sp. MIP2626]|nr:IS66 family insertion sequence element accessory protein TnpB [Pseudoalteromonas sp. MIP2626]